MELGEAIRQRRSVRRYTAEPVAREQLERILEDACWAPSAENYQPWHLVALTKVEDMERLRAILAGTAENMTPVLEERFPRHPAVVGETTRFIRTLGGAPVCVLVFLRKSYPYREPVLVSAAAAVENLLLSAWEQGLGSCWIGAPVSCGYGPAVTELFGPSEGELVAMVALGHPEQLPNPPKRKPKRWEIR